MDDTEKKDMENDLYDVILSLKSRADCRALLADLCTVKEVEQMAQRIRAASLLKQGCTYSDVMASTEISSATLSRVSRCLKYGEGYKRFVK